MSQYVFCLHELNRDGFPAMPFTLNIFMVHLRDTIYNAQCTTHYEIHKMAKMSISIAKLNIR